MVLSQWGVATQLSSNSYLLLGRLLAKFGK
jgi:hypothetical protein